MVRNCAQLQIQQSKCGFTAKSKPRGSVDRKLLRGDIKHEGILANRTLAKSKPRTSRSKMGSRNLIRQ